MSENWYKKVGIINKFFIDKKKIAEKKNYVFINKMCCFNFFLNIIKFRFLHNVNYMYIVNAKKKKRNNKFLL